MTTPDSESNVAAVELGRDRCLELLRGVPIGRVVLSIDCLPAALPVNLAVLEEDVVFFTDTGSKLDAVIEGQVVSIEADDIDLMDRTGWSVLVTGVAQLVNDQAEIAWANARIQAWAPGPHRFLVKVPATMISGRCLMWADQDGG